MPAFVVVDIDVKDPALYERYKQLAPVSIAAHGGKYIARGGKVDILEGDWTPRRLVILQFPDAAQARRWWESAGYAEAKRLRQQCADANMIIVEGL
jgi:uncharacterized protein (DUF1330 family)